MWPDSKIPRRKADKVLTARKTTSRSWAAYKGDEVDGIRWTEGGSKDDLIFVFHGVGEVGGERSWRIELNIQFRPAGFSLVFHIVSFVKCWSLSAIFSGERPSMMTKITIWHRKSSHFLLILPKPAVSQKFSQRLALDSLLRLSEHIRTRLCHCLDINPTTMVEVPRLAYLWLACWSSARGLWPHSVNLSSST
jgi:hypothetical protein